MPAVAMPALPSEQALSNQVPQRLRSEPLPLKAVTSHVSRNVRMAANRSCWISETAASAILAASPGCGVISMSFFIAR